MLNNALIFSLSANKELAKDVADILGLPVSEALVNHFADGEILCEPVESVRDQDVYIVQSTCNSVTEHLFEILVFVDACKRSSANEINIIMPYFGYARQDRKSKPRQPITARLVADLLKVAGVDRVITVDLHAPQIQGFFSCLVDEMTAIPLIADYYYSQDNSNVVVVSPDHGGVNRARRVAEVLNVPIAIVDKRRPKPNEAEVMNIVGNIAGKDCILIDDMIDTAGSCTAAAKALKEKGATSVRIACTHGVFSKGCCGRLNSGIFDEIVTTDSIPLRPELNSEGRFKVLSLAPMLARAIDHIQNGKPLSVVYDLYQHDHK